MYDIFADLPEQEAESVWAQLSERRPAELGWEGDDDPLLRALVD